MVMFRAPSLHHVRLSTILYRDKAKNVEEIRSDFREPILTSKTKSEMRDESDSKRDVIWLLMFAIIKHKRDLPDIYEHR